MHRDVVGGAGAQGCGERASVRSTTAAAARRRRLATLAARSRHGPLAPTALQIVGGVAMTQSYYQHVLQTEGRSDEVPACQLLITQHEGHAVTMRPATQVRACMLGQLQRLPACLTTAVMHKPSWRCCRAAHRSSCRSRGTGCCRGRRPSCPRSCRRRRCRSCTGAACRRSCCLAALWRMQTVRGYGAHRTSDGSSARSACAGCC